jgi:hypothetical protein
MSDQVKKPTQLPTTGKYSYKQYKCTKCQGEYPIGTNHYGECYPLCRKCGHVATHVCLEPVPEGMGVPEPWKLVKLGDICEIVPGMPLPKRD